MKVTVPVGVLVSLLLGVLLVTLLLVAHYQTNIASREQVRLAEGAIEIRGRHIETSALDYGAWDEAVDALTVRHDLDWADTNIGVTLFKNLGFDLSFVVAPDDTTMFGSQYGQRIDAPVWSVLEGGFDELVARQRAGRRNGSTSGLILANGRPAIAAVVPIRPLNPDPADMSPQYVLVFVETISDKLLADIERIYLLPHLTLELSGDGASSRVPLRLTNGVVSGHLIWDGARPGDTLLRAALPVWGFVVLGFGLLTLLILRQVRSAAGMLAESESRATRDLLTQLPNRLVLFDQLDAGLQRVADGDAGFAVLFLDLDGFKGINDTHGHEAGDEVLRQAADRMRKTMEPDAFIARLGGDEFVALLPGQTSLRNVQAIGQRVIREIEVPIALSGIGPVSISATIGAAFAPIDGSDALTLLRNADQALYLGKRGGKRQVRFHLSLTEQAAG